MATNQSPANLFGTFLEVMSATEHRSDARPPTYPRTTIGQAIFKQKHAEEYAKEQAEVRAKQEQNRKDRVALDVCHSFPTTFEDIILKTINDENKHSVSIRIPDEVIEAGFCANPPSFTLKLSFKTEKYNCQSTIPPTLRDLEADGVKHSIRAVPWNIPRGEELKPAYYTLDLSW